MMFERLHRSITKRGGPRRSRNKPDHGGNNYKNPSRTATIKLPDFAGSRLLGSINSEAIDAAGFPRANLFLLISGFRRLASLFCHAG
jgi:hypothetical protein